MEVAEQQLVPNEQEDGDKWEQGQNYFERDH